LLFQHQALSRQYRADTSVAGGDVRAQIMYLLTA